jgi:hypothetical protein
MFRLLYFVVFIIAGLSAIRILAAKLIVKAP